MNFSPVKRKEMAKWIIGIAAACILIFLGLQNIGAIAGALSRCPVPVRGHYQAAFDRLHHGGNIKCTHAFF